VARESDVIPPEYANRSGLRKPESEMFILSESGLGDSSSPTRGSSKMGAESLPGNSALE